MIVNFIIPGDINLPTGGYRYDKRILQEWKSAGLEFNLINLEGDFPFPTNASITNALKSIKTLPEADISVVDGLAGGAIPEFMEQLAERSPVVSLLHHPLCLETGLSRSQAKNLEQRERRGLTHVTGIVTTSQATKTIVADLFGVKASCIDTVLPGVERGELSKPHQDGPFRLLCIGSLIERKGHKYLVEALGMLPDIDWTLDCFGMQDVYSDVYKEVTHLIKAKGLTDRVTLHGAVSDQEIEHAYKDAHLFVLPSLYEGYGMAYAEAIVRGLPVIGTNAGAIPDTVPDTCGLLVEPMNSGQLKGAIQKMLSGNGTLDRFKAGCLTAAEQFPTWEKSAVKFKTILENWS